VVTAVNVTASGVEPVVIVVLAVTRFATRFAVDALLNSVVSSYANGPAVSLPTPTKITYEPAASGLKFKVSDPVVKESPAVEFIVYAFAAVQLLAEVPVDELPALL